MQDVEEPFLFIQFSAYTALSFLTQVLFILF